MLRTPWTLALGMMAVLLAFGCGDDSETTGGPVPDGGDGDGDGDGDAQDAGDAGDDLDASMADASADAAVLPPEPFDDEGCSAAIAPGMSTVELEHEGMTRKYLLYVPDSVDVEAPTPLVLNFHGLGSQATEQYAYAGVAISDERGWIAAFPEGLGDPGGKSFNAGVCCSMAGSPTHMADDAGFARAIVEDVAARVCVDKRRVYSTGMSNGGYMSEWNACKNADLFAAVAPVSALGLVQTDCEPSRSIPMIAFNGTTDPLVSYEGSETTITWWRDRNGCGDPAAREEYGGESFCDTWTDCDDGVQVTHCTITGMEHCWPGNPLVIPGFCASGGLDVIDANEMMYDFFERFTLP